MIASGGHSGKCVISRRENQFLHMRFLRQKLLYILYLVLAAMVCAVMLSRQINKVKNLS